MRSLFYILTAVFLSFFLMTCHTTETSLPPDMSKAKMIQIAQEAVSAQEWEAALQIYNEFLRRFPDDISAHVEAEYEIAFIAYKQKDYVQATERFQQVIQRYDNEEEADELPEWPLVLSKRLIDIIQEKTQ